MFLASAVKDRNVRRAKKILAVVARITRSFVCHIVACRKPAALPGCGYGCANAYADCSALPGAVVYLPVGRAIHLTWDMPSHRIVLLQADTPELITIVRALFQEYASAIGTDLEYQGFAAELAALPAPYTPPRGALFVAYVDGELAGCAALRPSGDGIGEMKRLYVRPAFRSVGLGNHLVRAVIQSARQARFGELRLDTLPSMSSAQALYRKLGFVEIPPYNDKYLPGTRFYALDLK